MKTPADGAASQDFIPFLSNRTDGEVHWTVQAVCRKGEARRDSRPVPNTSRFEVFVGQTCVAYAMK